MAEQASPATRRWWALGLIAAAQFMVIMDTSIIGVALPQMQADLGFTQHNLSWVFNAYVVAFGGLLLLGGRLSDLYGARRIFATGWTVLLVGSAVAGLAGSVGVELAGRAIQGAGAALIAPAALTLLMMLFGSRPVNWPRRWPCTGAAAPAGGTAGVFLGGVITEYLSWPWVFFINIPIAAIAIAATGKLMPAGSGARHGAVDVLGVQSPSPPGSAPPSTASSAHPRSAGTASRPGACSAAAVALLGLVRGPSGPPRPAAGPAVDLPHPEPRRGQRCAVPARRGVDPDVVLPEPVPATGPGLHRLPQRRRLAADDPADHGRDGHVGPQAIARFGPRR